jgi:hypothetical protein
MKNTTIRRVQIGMDTVLLIPSSWTAFVFNGYRYWRDDYGHFVIGAKVADENNSDLREKRA